MPYAQPICLCADIQNTHTHAAWLYLAVVHTTLVGVMITPVWSELEGNKYLFSFPNVPFVLRKILLLFKNPLIPE